MSEWMPIDTAPKDGSVILMCTEVELDAAETIRNISIFIGYWCNQSDVPWSFFYGTSVPRWLMFNPSIGKIVRSVNDVQTSRPLMRPTHWMPLPNLPAVVLSVA